MGSLIKRAVKVASHQNHDGVYLEKRETRVVKTPPERSCNSFARAEEEWVESRDFFFPYFTKTKYETLRWNGQFNRGQIEESA